MSRSWVSSSDWLAERASPILIAFGAAAWTGGSEVVAADRWKEGREQRPRKACLLKLVVPMQLNQLLAESRMLSEADCGPGRHPDNKKDRDVRLRWKAVQWMISMQSSPLLALGCWHISCLTVQRPATVADNQT